MLLYTRETPPGLIVVPLMISGIGVGCVFQPTLVGLQAQCTKSRRAVIISNRNFFRCAGGACGLAMAAAVLQAQLRATLPPEYAYLAESTYSAPKGPNVPVEVLDAYMSASHAVFIMQVPIIGLTVLGMFFVRDRGLAPLDELEQENLATAEETSETQAVHGDADVEAEARVEVSEKGHLPAIEDSATEVPEEVSPEKNSSTKEEKHRDGETV